MLKIQSCTVRLISSVVRAFSLPIYYLKCMLAKQFVYNLIKYGMIKLDKD